MVSAIFVIDKIFLVSLERNDFYLTFKFKTSAVFDVFTVTISILLNMLTMSDNILYLATFTFKLAKHKMATKMLRKPHIFMACLT